MMFSVACRSSLAAAAIVGCLVSCGGETAPEPAEASAPAAEAAPQTPPVSPPSELASPEPTRPDVPHIGDEDELAEAAGEPETYLDTTEEALGNAEATLDSGPVIEQADAVFADVLALVVTPGGLVRYELLADPRYEGSLNLVVRSYANATLPDATPARKAFWCNAYNANVLSMALAESRKPDFTSVEKIPGFFDERTITVAGETMTLNALENDHIRPLDDPRTHAALVCAAMSCPPLRSEPYHPDRLDAQLDDQCRRWINDGQKNRVQDGALALSRIFEWYGSDFETPRFQGVHGFLRAYARPETSMGRLLAAEPRPLITWLTYDWSLNQAPGAATGGK